MTDQKKRDAMFKKQYFTDGGFCGKCGDAQEPILGNVHELGRCRCNTDHIRVAPKMVKSEEMSKDRPTDEEMKGTI